MERTMDGLKQRLNKTMKTCVANANAAADAGGAVLKEYAGRVCAAVVEKDNDCDGEKTARG